MRTIYYWSGLSQANHNIFTAYPEALPKISLLMQGHTREADLDLKKHGSHALYTIRLNRSDRLLFTTIEREGKSYLLLLEVIDNHDYQKSRFLKSGVLRKYLDVNAAEIEQVIELPDFISGSDTTCPVTLEDGEDTIDPTPITHYQQNWLPLDVHQQAATEREEYPLLVSGPPGSGKSCVAINLMMKAVNTRVEGDDLPLLCVTESPYVAAHLSQQWSQLPESLDASGNPRDDVRFLTYRQLISEILIIPEEQIVGESHFKAWYGEYRTKLKRGRHKQDNAENPFADHDLVYQECRVIAGCPDQATYMSLGQSQSLFSADCREQLWAIYARYQDALAEDSLISLPFHEIPVANTFGYTVVDEAQDFSIRQLMNLLRMSSGNRIAFAMDSNQNLMSRVPIRILLKQHCHVSETPLTETTLEGTYRCPAHVVMLANGVLTVRNTVTGGKTDKTELSTIHQADSETDLGEVIWERPPADATEFQEALSRLRATHGLKETELALITPAEYVERVKALTGSDLVFTPEQIKGLEYPCIVTAGLLDTPSFREASSQLPDRDTATLSPKSHRPKDRANDGLLHAPYFNRLFVAFTRATKVLVVFQEARREINNLLEHLRAFAPQPADEATEVADSKADAEPIKSVAPETTLEDWRVEIQRLIENGAMVQAKGLFNQHLAPELHQTFEQYTAIDTSSAEETKAEKPAELTPATSSTNPQTQSPNHAKQKQRQRRRNGRRRNNGGATRPGQQEQAQAAAQGKQSNGHHNNKKKGKKRDKHKPGSLGRQILSEEFSAAMAGIESPMQRWQQKQRNSTATALVAEHRETYQSLSPAVLAALDITDDDKKPNDGLELLDYICDHQAAQIGLLVLIVRDENLTQQLMQLITPYFAVGIRLLEAQVTYIERLTLELTRFGGLVNFWPQIAPHIPSIAMNRSYPDFGGRIKAGSSLLFHLLKLRLHIFSTHWYTIEHKITQSGFNRAITTQCVDQDKSPLYLLTASDEGITLLDEHWDFFKTKIDSEALTRPITHNILDDNQPQKGRSPFCNLCMSDSGCDFLRRHWADIYPLLAPNLTEALNRHLEGISYNQGKSPLYFLAKTPEGQQLIADHWEDFKDHLTESGLTHQSAYNNTSPLYYLCLTDLGQKLLLEHWAHLQPLIPRVSFHKPVSQGPDVNMTPFFFLCFSAAGQEFVHEAWDYLVNQLPKAFFEQKIPLGDFQGRTLIHCLCSVRFGETEPPSHREFFRRKMMDLGVSFAAALGMDSLTRQLASLSNDNLWLPEEVADADADAKDSPSPPGPARKSGRG